MPLHSRFSTVHVPDNIFIHEMVLGKTAQHGSATAIIDGDRQVTFIELRAHVLSAAAALHQIGVRHNDVVFILAKNCYDNFVAFLAITSLGAVLATVNSLSTPEELEFYLADCRPSYLLLHEQVADTAIEVAARLSNLQIKRTVIIGTKPGYQNFQALYTAEFAAALPRPTVDPRQQVASILYSSGTTGRPKGVMLTHFNLVSSLTQFRLFTSKMTASTERVKTYSPLPLYHLAGILTGFFFIDIGGLLILSPKFVIEEFLASIQKYKVNFLFLVPPLIVLLTKLPLVDEYDLSSLKYVLAGAAPIGADMERAFMDKFNLKSMRQGYGMTEYGPFAFCNGESANTYKTGTVGQVVMNTEAKLVDPETGLEVAPHVLGEIWLRGTGRMKGYHGNPAATEAAFTHDGWYKTGDLGICDEEGFLTIVDRLKELIKYKGFQVAPADLEDLLMTHPAVADVAVIGLPDPDAGELPRAYIQLQAGMSASQADIQNFVAEKVAPHKKLRGGVEFVDVIPKSASGKILRRLLRDKLKREVERVNAKL